MESYLFSLFPVGVLSGEEGQVAEFELQGRRFCGTDETIIITVRYTFLLLQVDRGKREARRRVEHGKNTIPKLLCFLKENGIFLRKMVSSQQSTQYTYCRLQCEHRIHALCVPSCGNHTYLERAKVSITIKG